MSSSYFLVWDLVQTGLLHCGEIGPRICGSVVPPLKWLHAVVAIATFVPRLLVLSPPPSLEVMNFMPMCFDSFVYF